MFADPVADLRDLQSRQIPKGILEGSEALPGKGLKAKRSMCQEVAISFQHHQQAVLCYYMEID